MWRMINYEVCGRGHLKTDTPCQDKTIVFKEKEVYVVALSDGAGSANYSHYGAQCVVNLIAKFLSKNFDELISEENGVKVKSEILKMIKEKLQHTSKEYKCSIKDLAATLLAIAIKNDKFLIVHLGDGIIGMVKNNVLKVASNPENGEFSNSTVFVTSEDAINYIKLFKGNTENINGFILMSDGTGESFYDKRKKVLSKSVKKIINWSILLPKERIEQLIGESFKGIIRNNTLDDCSIALLVNEDLSKDLYSKFNTKEKYAFFNINIKSNILSNKKIKKYENIIRLLNEKPASISVLAKRVHIKKKYLKKYLLSLEALGFIQCVKRKYCAKLNI